jgi:hypothetical protein
MSVVFRPAFCPMCETPELIEKVHASGLQVTVRYSCPKCHWWVGGLSPAQPSTRVPLASTDTRRGMRAHERLDQPMTRYYGPVDRVDLEERVP